MPDATAFIRANTRLLPVPMVPEIRLHLAAESLPIWQKTEEELGRLERAAALVGVRLGRRAGAGALRAGQPRRRGRAKRSRPRCRLGPRRHCRRQGGSRLGAGRGLDPYALSAIALNAEANGIAFETTGADLLASAPRAFGLVMVGDLFYERPLAERALAFIDGGPGSGADVLVGDPQRSYFPKDRFRRIAEYSVPVTRDLEDMEIKRTAVWRLA